MKYKKIYIHSIFNYNKNTIIFADIEIESIIIVKVLKKEEENFKEKYLFNIKDNL